MSKTASTDAGPMEAVAAELEEYARKGVFRGFSPATIKNGQATFRIVWHRHQRFECVVDPKRGTIKFPVVLPKVPAGSEMDRAFKAFVKERHDSSRPEHRRIDFERAEAKAYNRNGNAMITMTVRNGDYAYAARRLINLIHEVYLVFLMDGRFYDYLIETFNLDPDNPR